MTEQTKDLSHNVRSSQADSQLRPHMLPQPIAPDLVYTIDQVAATFDVEKKWVKKHMLEPSDDSVPCRHFRRGNCIPILGSWIQAWIRQELDRASKG